MSKKKEKLLNKYLDKKRKQRKRDDLLSQIAEIEKKREKINIKKEDVLDDEENVLCDELSNDDLLFEEEYNNIKEEDNIIKKENNIYEEEDNIYEDIAYEDNNIYKENDSESDQEINLDDFLGENKDWTPVECSYRLEEIQEFRKSLPIFYEQSDIISLIRSSTITVIKGETGCGKTTQIPQFLYEGGFCNNKLIGITQPRRISTISISQRINLEINENKCGYKIRYDSNINKDTKIKIMTDGILLKEIQNDFLLSKYSVIILDEIHERSANMDILISLLSRIIKIRKEKYDELKLIMMSATCMKDEIEGFFYKNDGKSIKEYEIDGKSTKKFENDTNFNKNNNSIKKNDGFFNMKINYYNILSNNHKVKIFYEEKDPLDFIKSIYDRIIKIIKNKRDDINNDILVFLPSKNDIYLLFDKLALISDCIILPLHSSLSKNDQNLIYKKYDQRKIILSTNISETSITIPGIYYVIDSGLVKKKYINNFNTIEYKIEFISKSSANQRSGRAGRTGPGICYRIYSGNTFNKFDDLDTPKIFYEPLDEIILDLVSLGIENIYKFPFINKPNDLSIKRSLNELKRLGILDINNKLTKIGKCIRELPMSPRISKLLCVPNTLNLLPDLIDLVSLMSVDIEIKRNNNNKNYYLSEKSDLLVILKIFRDFEKDKNKKEFSKRMNINLSTFLEVQKIRDYILNKFKINKRDDKKDSLIKEDKRINLLIDDKKDNLLKEDNLLTEDKKNSLRKILYSVYLDRVAMPFDVSYWYKNKAVYPSNNSIEINGEYVIFEYLIKGNKKLYMKNITLIDSEWFN